jgi:ABC-2 type transport system permease protein
MSKFFTLVRRDMADNRGALIITPLVIAAILLFVTLSAALTGNARFGFDPKDFANAPPGTTASADIDIDGQTTKVQRDAQGRVVITSPDGKTRTVDEMVNPEARAALPVVLSFGTAVASTLPLGIAAIAILFVLAGGLHDERKDRTILFWKSMPVTDLQTTGAKLVSIVGGGFLTAFAIVIALNLAIVLIAMATMGNVGITGVDIGAVLANTGKIWLVMLLGLLVYIGWAMPVYGWMTMVSAWAPKMPFIVGFAPMIVVPLVYMAVAFRGNENDPILSALWDPLGRLIGEPIVEGFQGLERQVSSDIPTIPLNDILAALGKSVTQPGFLIGLLVAAALVYAASEIRRRRAL